ncbi:integrase catalytic domain-containing protein [Trichonephila clavipes]|nr:integrase catalytic domain-containing protein [Trichonephila clavipes]
MREIKADGSGVSLYMPHHGLYRPEKSTTKLRTVFNASSPSTSGKSLNSIQFNGGLLHEDLFSIMVRFRKHKYAFTADIEKMFRMINIYLEQTCLQRILWKKGIGKPIKTYELTTVTYGTVSAPYLATRTLKQLAMDEANHFPLAAIVVLSDCYMDDILSGSESIEEVIELQHQLIEMFKTAGMPLHKWCGNLPEITCNLQEYAFLESDETKALGIIWNPKLDCFLFRIEQQRLTSFPKRMVLSTIARIFDPLGLLGPIIRPIKDIYAKIVVAGIGMEEESIELHAFSDASKKAYGSSIYLKSISPLGEVKVCLVTSKSRVSPLKQISIPRHELCGAVLAAKLLKTFAANRVSKIHQLSSRDQWHHIATEQNSADVLSRGLLPEELRDDSLWWHGPELLQSTYSTTVIAEPTQRDDFDCELRVSERTLETSLLNSKNFDFFNHLMDLFNNYFKIIHIVSYIYRFIENCRSKVKKRGPLTTSEDDKGVLRVGGRLEKASMPYSQKHPAILAKYSKLSKIYFITLHKKLFHVGPQGLLNAVRLRVWALGGRNLANQNLAAYFTEEGIEWNFIPPRAPHMGGVWEAGIKSVKYHLKRALGRSRLTYEEFETVIIQEEGILNSRPLTPISNDFDNFEVLTPAHFFIGRSINSILEPIVINISDNRLSCWQKTTKVIQVVWKKWSTDYLNTLQQRGKWMIEKDNVMCGTMVIVMEDFTPVCNWLLGRVVEAYHGSDGKVRTVRIKTKTGEFKRPITI